MLNDTLITAAEDPEKLPALSDHGFWTEEECAAFLDRKVTTLRAMAARRRGPPRIRASNRVLYRIEAVLNWLRQNEIDPEAGRKRKAVRCGPQNNSETATSPVSGDGNG